MIAWSTVRSALQGWVSASSGIPAARVIWAQQNGPRPTDPYITLRLMSVRRIGQDWLDVVNNPTPSAGAEILHTSRGQRECILALQAYGGAFYEPVTLLHSTVAGANLQSNRDSFNTAGIGMAGFGPVQSLDGVLDESTYEPRAIVECRFFLSEEVAETSTFIEFVELENLDEGTSTYVPSNPI